MDRNAPVARRTRSKEAEYWKQRFLELKKDKNNSNNIVANTGIILDNSDDYDDEDEEENESVDEDDDEGEVEIVESWDAEQQPEEKQEKDSESQSESDSVSESEKSSDSETEDDDDDDKDYVVEKFNFTFQEKDKNDIVSYEEEEGECDKKDETLKRKGHAEEECVVVDSDDNDVSTKSVNRDNGSVARRTRSQTVSKPKKQKVELGSVNSPYCIDVEEEDPLEEESQSSNNKVDSDHDRERTDFEKNLKKRGRPQKDSKFIAITVLANSILDDEDDNDDDDDDDGGDDDDDGDDDKASRGVFPDLPAEKPSLPLKFRFGVEESKTPEKSEFEKELDGLWEEFDFLQGCSQIGSSDYYARNDGMDHSHQYAKVDAGALCREGNHCLVLNEEIGIICKYCSFVKLEIKYILPSFNTCPWGRSERKENHKADGLHFDEVDLGDWGYDSQPGCDPCVVTKGTVWDLVPGTWNVMYAHQREGFEFIWKNIAGGILLNELKNQASSNTGRGCIISHAPGTGKSRLTIVFLNAYMKLFPKCRTVLLAPKIMLDVWNRELKKWKVDIPFYDLSTNEFSGKENVAAMNFLSLYRSRKRSEKFIRMVKILSWKKDGGILAISYSLFESLAGEGKTADGKVDAVATETYEKALLKLPDLVVLDEGHTPRNKNSSIFKVLSKIKTEKRIILSGTPFQNNFDELFNTLCLVRPSFVEAFQSEHYGQQQPSGKHKAERKKWNSLISSISRLGDTKSGNYQLKKLKAMLEPFVHIHKGDILQQKLPGLRDFVVILKPNDLQKSLFDGVQGIKEHFLANRLMSFISVHPSLLNEDDKRYLWSDTDDIERHGLNPEAGVKMHFLMELIKISQATNDKVLVFSQFIEPLVFIIKQLNSNFGWTEGREVVYMDGQVDVKLRQSSISAFNDLSSEVKVLLASIRACGEGITLVGASRVVLLDVVWNPSVERQAICRAYRLGQKRVVSVYHLLCGSSDYEKYYRQTEKEWMSEAVFSSTGRDDIQHKAYDISDDKILEAIVLHDKLKDKFLDIRPKDNLFENFGLVNEHLPYPC